MDAGRTVPDGGVITGRFRQTNTRAVVHVLTPITDNRVVRAGRVSVISILFAVRAVTDGAGQMEIRNTLIPNQCHISVNVRVRNSVSN